MTTGKQAGEAHRFGLGGGITRHKVCTIQKDDQCLKVFLICQKLANLPSYRLIHRCPPVRRIPAVFGGRFPQMPFKKLSKKELITKM